MKPVAQLLAPVFCMSCGGLLTDSVRFRWGALPECYRVGETARWWQRQDGSIEPPFQLLAGDSLRWNFGEARYANVLVLDEDVTDSRLGIQCPICAFVYDGISVRIQGGVVQSPTPEKLESIAWLRRGSVEPVKAFEVRPDHTTVLHEDWYRAACNVPNV